MVYKKFSNIKRKLTNTDGHLKNTGRHGTVIVSRKILSLCDRVPESCNQQIRVPVPVLGFSNVASRPRIADFLILKLPVPIPEKTSAGKGLNCGIVILVKFSNFYFLNLIIKKVKHMLYSKKWRKSAESNQQSANETTNSLLTKNLYKIIIRHYFRNLTLTLSGFVLLNDAILKIRNDLLFRLFSSIFHPLNFIWRIWKNGNTKRLW